MLANSPYQQVQAGLLNKDVHLSATSLYELINFIADELPRWRDLPAIQNETSETVLTSRLSLHLSTTARHTPGWDFLQFQPEAPDEHQKGRKIDLIAAPSGSTIWIAGRCYGQFATLLPIECKRLPTPKGKNRDEWEYVINRKATTGGIQRFKAGHHAAAHSLALMIAYVQDESPKVWYDRLNNWITDLAKSNQVSWTSADCLRLDPSDVKPGVAIYRSSHAREKGITKNIDMRHLWIEMVPVQTKQ
jgi:hypothetical protein